MSLSEYLEPRLAIDSLTSEKDFHSRWNSTDVLSLPNSEDDRYITGFASSDRCVEEVLRLRYEVFNLELGEGLSGSAATGLDRDEFDEQMTHVVLLDRKTGRVVGTYRVQTVLHGLAQRGVYSASEYDIEPLSPYFGEMVELGRACLAAEHRTFPALVSIWLGIGAFMNLTAQRYLFGCCSLTTQDPDDGWRALKTIRKGGYLHDSLYLRANAGYSCGHSSREHSPELGSALALPKLFKTYMRLGVKVISEPAIDRRFGTVDFLVMLDGKEVSLSRLDVLK
jgi:putative hemolysin